MYMTVSFELLVPTNARSAAPRSCHCYATLWGMQSNQHGRRKLWQPGTGSVEEWEHAINTVEEEHGSRPQPENGRATQHDFRNAVPGDALSESPEHDSGGLQHEERKLITVISRCRNREHEFVQHRTYEKRQEDGPNWRSSPTRRTKDIVIQP